MPLRTIADSQISMLQRSGISNRYVVGQLTFSSAPFLKLVSCSRTRLPQPFQCFLFTPVPPMSHPSLSPTHPLVWEITMVLVFISINMSGPRLWTRTPSLRTTKMKFPQVKQKINGSFIETESAAKADVKLGLIKRKT